MKISELLGPDRILPGFAAKDKWKAIEKIVDHLVQGGHVPAAEKRAVINALFARERVATTGLEHGVAIPHAAVDRLDQPAAAVALSPAGVPFESMDGQPARIVILLVIPRRMMGQHMRTLAAIARLLESEEMRKEMLDGAPPERIIDAIRREERD